MMISFIIPTYKNDKSLIKCIVEIISNALILNVIYEIIVVDNFITDEYISKLSVFSIPNLKVLKNPVVGAHHSRRLGLYNSNGDLVIFVDDDNYLTSDYISFIISSFENRARDIFIGCASEEFVKVDWKKNGFSPFTYACGSLVGVEFKSNIPVFWGAGMSMNRELAFKIFKEDLIVEGRMSKSNYIMSGEDHEYSLRAFFAKAEFIYYSGIGLQHDFDQDRLNREYYDKVQIGFVYAAYILKIYYDFERKNKFYSNLYSGFLYNLLFAIGYNLKNPFKLSGSLVLKDSLNFSKFKNRFMTVNNVI
jgi:glycosyltransferase involved in cell wall biosynthesis